MMRRIAGMLLALSATAAAISGCKGGEERRELALGGQAYLGQCAVCHGTTGGGDGPLAASIAADGGAPPAVLDRDRLAALGRDGVIRVLESGVHLRSGSSMPLWGPHLGARWSARIADYVMESPGLGERGRTAIEGFIGTAPATQPSGRRTYVLYCSGCHGPHGGGDGFFSPSVESQLRPPRLDSKMLAALDEATLSKLIGLEAGHAPAAATMPGWLRSIPDGERAALHEYLRRMPGPLAR